MQKLADRHKCSGCHACYSICPTGSISMAEDNEGFLYPEIIESSCVNCGKCVDVCPVISEYVGNSVESAYACINNNCDIVQNSSSGGIFSLLAENIIKNGGIVFGAAFDEDLNVRHIEVNNVDNIKLLRGSKYVQSKIGNVYNEAKEHLEKGKLVLFTGTPCQISGLYAYLDKTYENLFTQDIICHGVSSPLAWHSYLSEMKKIYRSEIDKDTIPQFRDKRKGWSNFSLTIKFKNDKILSETLHKNMFMRAFLENYILRYSCYNCHYKSKEKLSDITLADFWGISHIMPSMFNKNGVSLVIVNTSRGKKLFDLIKKDITYHEVNFDEAIKYNSAMYKSADLPNNRDSFFTVIKNKSFICAAKRFTKNKIEVFSKKCIRYVLRNIKR